MLNKSSVFNFLALTLTIIGCQAQEKNAESSVDLNGDEVVDIRFEYDETGYYQLTDRNFDGKIDESVRYNSDHYLVGGSSDDNFDGIFETTIEYRHSLISKVLVDTNNNQIFDLIHRYKHSLVTSTERYSDKKGTPRVTQISYKFGYPLSQEETEVPSMTEHQFHYSAISE